MYKSNNKTSRNVLVFLVLSIIFHAQASKAMLVVFHGKNCGRTGELIGVIKAVKKKKTVLTFSIGSDWIQTSCSKIKMMAININSIKEVPVITKEKELRGIKTIGINNIEGGETTQTLSIIKNLKEEGVHIYLAIEASHELVEPLIKLSKVNYIANKQLCEKCSEELEDLKKFKLPKLIKSKKIKNGK